jgi:hypothetical protein
VHTSGPETGIMGLLMSSSLPVGGTMCGLDRWFPRRESADRAALSTGIPGSLGPKATGGAVVFLPPKDP